MALVWFRLFGPCCCTVQNSVLPVSTPNCFIPFFETLELFTLELDAWWVNLAFVFGMVPISNVLF